MDDNIALNDSLLEVLFGKFDLEKDILLVIRILLLAKYFIFKCELSIVIQSLVVFKARLRKTHQLE